MDGVRLRGRSASRLLRDASASSRIEGLVIVAVTTILLVRLYLHLTGYPQVGGATLHIAHSLWGGLLMVVALCGLLTYLGRTPHAFGIVAGGIGFGLFLDEIGKFLTKTNDYFYRPSVAIMYVVVLLLLLANRAIHGFRPVTAREDLANAASTAVDGVMRGLTSAERARATAQLRSARAGGADPEAADEIERLLARCRDRDDRRSRVGAGVKRMVPPALRGDRGTWAAAVTLTVFSGLMLVHAVVTLADDLNGSDRDLTVWFQFVGVTVTTLLCVVGLTGLWGRRGWALRVFSAAALITVLFVEVVDFAVAEFGALLNVAVGAAALAVFSNRLAGRDRDEPIVPAV
ncbi:hypothetical protein ACWDUD_14650 [Rhodococcus sp. NPDC003382]